MSVAQSTADFYEKFEPKKDSLYFKIGAAGIISFHGSNCNIRKRMTDAERDELLRDARFLQAGSDCYINLDKIRGIEENMIYFGDGEETDKRIAVSGRSLQRIRQALTERKTERIAAH